MRLAVVEVRDVGRRTGASPDLDRLAERVQVAVAERVPDVGVIEAAVPARLFGQGSELLGRGIAAGRVVEPGAETDRALLQPLAEECPHPVECAGVGRHVVPAECRDAERRVADQRGDVEARPAVVAAKEARYRVPVVGDRRIAVEAGIHLDHRVEVLAPRERREADPVDTDHLGRDPLADLGLVPRVVEDDEAAVTVQVDEARGDDPSRGVDRARGVRGFAQRPG